MSSQALNLKILAALFILLQQTM